MALASNEEEQACRGAVSSSISRGITLQVPSHKFVCLAIAWKFAASVESYIRERKKISRGLVDPDDSIRENDPRYGEKFAEIVRCRRLFLIELSNIADVLRIRRNFRFSDVSQYLRLIIGQIYTIYKHCFSFDTSVSIIGCYISSINERFNLEANYRFRFPIHFRIL